MTDKVVEAGMPVISSAKKVRMIVVHDAQKDREIYLAVDSIKSFASRDVGDADPSELPEGTQVLQTFITLKGEARGFLVNGRPEDLAGLIRDRSILL